MRESQAMTPDYAAPPAVEIRQLLPDEWAAVREVRLAALAESPGAFFSTLEQEQAFDEQEWRRRLAHNAYFGAWAARSDPGLTGMVATFPERRADGQGPRPATPGGAPAAGDDGPTWHLVAMWVSPARRGQGIADRLVAAVCDLARAEGASQVALWVADANLRAQAFYRRLGFRPSGERGVLRPGQPGQPDLWEARMIRDLRDQPAG
jgi:ribosomal protein S18 acetylase RimI-like enzyme